jgi:hypothetical protein
MGISARLMGISSVSAETSWMGPGGAGETGSSVVIGERVSRLWTSVSSILVADGCQPAQPTNISAKRVTSAFFVV